MNIYNKISTLAQRGTPLVIVTAIDKQGKGPAEVGNKMVVTKDQSFGTVGGGALEHHAIDLAQEIFTTKTSFKKTYVLNEGAIIENAETLPMTCGGVVTLFFEYVGPTEYITIFGAGHIGQALTNVLKTLNFHITVVDYRKTIIDEFIGADELVLSSFVDYIEQEKLIEQSFVIVCTPSHRYDYDVLHNIIDRKIPLKYIGMICSAEKLKDYIDKTKATFKENIDLTNFYSPIGLDLGGGSPAEIAISIASEVLAISHHKTAVNHMREQIKAPYRYWED